MPRPAPYAQAQRRPLRIFAFDPMLGRDPSKRLTVEVYNERLLPGPSGAQVEVVDYDGAENALYHPVDLDDPAVLMTRGLEPSQSDPRFHQQMVYAVAMKVIENFETALGRRLMFRGRRKLRLYPHAFRGANAFYDPGQIAVLFGYFHADPDDPGPNVPGQDVFTCLSHDVIAHEVTHALIDRLRPRFLQATNPDVYALHEGFSDIVAIFQHFSFREILEDVVQGTRSDLRRPNDLAQLAAQFGYATGGGQALRSAGAAETPDPLLYGRVHEPHERGAILVAAVFDAFFGVYQSRIADLVRIATGGTGVLPPGNLHPDLVRRIAREASKTAQHFLSMAIRSFEYLPPVDVSFGDFLRALVTTDRQAVPGDERGLRAAVVEAFRARGIYPDGVTSLAEESLAWPVRDDALRLPVRPQQESLVHNAQAFDRGPGGRRSPGSDDESRLGEWAVALRAFARRNARRLGLDPALALAVTGFHTVFRVSPDGQLLVELVARFVQEDQSVARDPAFGGLRLFGGSTVVAGADGRVRHAISKPLTRHRRDALRAWVAARDARDPMLAWGGAGYEKRRMQLQSFNLIHRSLPARRPARQGSR